MMFALKAGYQLWSTLLKIQRNGIKKNVGRIMILNNDIKHEYDSSRKPDNIASERGKVIYQKNTGKAGFEGHTMMQEGKRADVLEKEALVNMQAK
mmetsp:Transcript_13673/g.20254  ORF Transcript_13673/g.20254 Transcript_13673/m.20254 type:complete len:95 (-) Transcript_13673:496-780(-)